MVNRPSSGLRSLSIYPSTSPINSITNWCKSSHGCENDWMRNCTKLTTTGTELHGWTSHSFHARASHEVPVAFPKWVGRQHIGECPPRECVPLFPICPPCISVARSVFLSKSFWCVREPQLCCCCRRRRCCIVVVLLFPCRKRREVDEKEQIEDLLKGFFFLHFWYWNGIIIWQY